MSHPLVSVIMPAYNAEKFISESIHSVISQTYTNWELIIINDGSTDSTEAVIKELITVEARIKYISQKNAKQGKARNEGIKVASGGLIAFLDADDVWYQHKLQKQVEVMMNNECTLCFSDGVIINDKNIILKETMKVKDCEYQGTSALIDFFHSNKIPTQSVVCYKNAVIKAGYFSEFANPYYAEDYDLWLRMLLTGAVFKSVSDKLFAYSTLR